jgi:hypothetical protein
MMQKNTCGSHCEFGDRPKVHRMLADVLKRTGQYEEALVHLNEAEKLERQQLTSTRSLP